MKMKVMNKLIFNVSQCFNNRKALASLVDKESNEANVKETVWPSSATTAGASAAMLSSIMHFRK